MRASTGGVPLLLIPTVLLLAITLLRDPGLSGGYAWDALNTLGWVAFGCMLYLFFETGGGPRTRIHQIISYVLLGGVLAHVGLHIVLDATLWHYLRWDAPLYMLSGTGALLVVIAIMVLALPAWRRRWGQSRTEFQQWHYWLSLTGIGLTAYHVLGTEFSIDGPVESAALLGVCLGTIAMHRARRTQVRTAAIELAVLPLVAMAFVLLKGLMQ